MQEVVAKELANTQEVGSDLYVPKDAVEEDPSVHKEDVAMQEAGEVDQDGRPGGGILEPLPEERAAMHVAAQEGDAVAALAEARWQKLEAEGKLTTYGSVASSSASGYRDDDSTYDLVDDEDLEEAVADSLGQLRPQTEPGEGESSKAAERRALALIPEQPLRQLKPEPEDDMEPEEATQLDEWPTLDQHVPVASWHPSRFVFDNRGRLVLPPGPAHPMYGFLPSARTEVSQLELNNPATQPFFKSVGMAPGKRFHLNFKLLGKSYHLWDPRLQNLLSQVVPTEEGQRVSVRRRKWREALQYRKLGIRLSELHSQADRLGITMGHPQRPMQPNYVWPDPLPVSIDQGQPSLTVPSPPAGSPAASASNSAARQGSGAEEEEEEDQAATTPVTLDRLARQLHHQTSLATQLELQLKIQQAGNGHIMQQWQQEQAAKVKAEQHLEGAHKRLRATQLKLGNQQYVTANLQSQLLALQAAQQAAGSEEGQQALAQLQARYDSLMEAYSVGKEMYELGKAEMDRRDAAHAQLVQLYMSLADSEEQLELQNRTLTLRLQQLRLQRDALHGQIPDSTARRQLAEVTKERNDLAVRVKILEDNNLAQYDLLAKAEKTIDQLAEQINKPSGPK